MKLSSLAALATLVAAPAFAQTAITIDFEGAAGYVNPVLDFYNGGTDALGQSGTHFGIAFTEAAVALSNDDLGPYYSNAPTPLTVMFAMDGSAVMNVAAGFIGTVGVWYSADSFVLQGVNVYSGLNGTGSLLASFNLVANAQADGCSSSAYCRFDQLTSSFAGTAKSITFGNAANMAAFDNISITAVPEPTTWLLMAAGLVAVGVAQRKRKV